MSYMVDLLKVVMNQWIMLLRLFLSRGNPHCYSVQSQFSVPSYVTNLCYSKLKSQLADHYST